MISGGDRDAPIRKPRYKNRSKAFEASSGQLLTR